MLCYNCAESRVWSPIGRDRSYGVSWMRDEACKQFNDKSNFAYFVDLLPSFYVN